MLTIKNITDDKFVGSMKAFFESAENNHELEWAITLDEETKTLKSTEAIKQIADYLITANSGDKILKTKSGLGVALVGNYQDTSGAKVHLTDRMVSGSDFNAVGELKPTITYFNSPNKNGRTLWANSFNPITGDCNICYADAVNAPLVCPQGDSWVHQDFDGDFNNEVGRKSLIGSVKSFEELLKLLSQY